MFYNHSSPAPSTRGAKKKQRKTGNTGLLVRPYVLGKHSLCCLPYLCGGLGSSGYQKIEKLVLSRISTVVLPHSESEVEVLKLYCI